MVSIVQNFICTKSERLEILKNNITKLGKVFKDFEFFVNYGSLINLDEVYKLYKDNVPNLNFYNNLEEDWAAVTLSMATQISTPYTMFLCEDMVVNTNDNKIHKCINEYIDNNYDYLLFTKLHKYLQQEYINGYTPYNSNISPGYKKLKEYDSEKDIVIYSCDSDLIEYGTLGFYENEGQIELHIDEGIKL